MEFPIGREEESVTEMEGMGNTIIHEEMALKMACGACEPVRDIRIGARVTSCGLSCGGCSEGFDTDIRTKEGPGSQYRNR